MSCPTRSTRRQFPRRQAEREEKDPAAPAPRLVYFLTPAPNRNRDSMTQTLLDQIKQVALPEVRLFNRTSTANYCTLYQKDCTVGDSIALDQWALPLFFP